MKKTIVLFLFFTLLCSISYSQQTNAESGTDQPVNNADVSSSSEQESASATTVVSLMGFGFTKDTRQVVHLDYAVGTKKPYKGKIKFGIGLGQHSFQLIVNNGETGVKADMVKPDVKVVNGKKIMIYKKIGRVNLLAQTTEFKEKIQIGDINVFNDEKTKKFVGKYKSYLNVLPEKKVEQQKKAPIDDSNTSK